MKRLPLLKELRTFWGVNIDMHANVSLLKGFVECDGCEEGGIVVPVRLVLGSFTGHSDKQQLPLLWYRRLYSQYNIFYDSHDMS